MIVALLFMPLILQAGYASTVNLCYCIGSVPDPDEAARFDVVVLDLDEAPEWLVEELVSEGKTVLAYINVGYAEEWRDYWEGVLGAGVVHDASEYEGEYFVEYWSPLWRSIMYDMVNRAADKGFSGVYLDNIDAAVAVSETGFTWSSSVNPLMEMALLVKDISARMGEKPVMVNIGVATSLLHDEGFLSAIWGVLREEVFTMLEDKCYSRLRPPEEWVSIVTVLRDLLQASNTGIKVSVVEFANSPWEAMALKTIWGGLGVDLVAQPSCDPYYENPPWT